MGIESLDESGTTFTVTVSDETEIEWAGDNEDAPEPTLADLKVGAIVKEIEVDELDDGFECTARTR